MNEALGKQHIVPRIFCSLWTSDMLGAKVKSLEEAVNKLRPLEAEVQSLKEKEEDRQTVFFFCDVLKTFFFQGLLLKSLRKKDSVQAHMKQLNKTTQTYRWSDFLDAFEGESEWMEENGEEFDEKDTKKENKKHFPLHHDLLIVAQEKTFQFHEVLTLIKVLRDRNDQARTNMRNLAQKAAAKAKAESLLENLRPSSVLFPVKPSIQKVLSLS